MYCRECGHQVKDKAIICGHCGTPLDEDSNASRQEPDRTRPQWSWFTMFVTISIIMVLVLIAIIAGL